MERIVTDLKVLKTRKRTLETLIAGASFIPGSKGIPSRHQWVGVSGEALAELMALGGIRITCSVSDLNQLNALRSSLDEEIRDLERDELIAQFKAAPAAVPVPAPVPAPATVPYPSLQEIMTLMAPMMTKMVTEAVAAAANTQKS